MRKNLSQEQKNSLISELIYQNRKAGMLGAYCQTGFPLCCADEKLADMLGYENTEELTHAVHDGIVNIIHPNDMPQVMKDIGSEYEEGMIYETTCRMKRKDDVWLWISCSGKVIRTNDGELVLFAVCTDMSSFIHSRKKLKDTEPESEREQELKKLLKTLKQRYQIISALGTAYREICLIDLPDETYTVVSGEFEGQTGNMNDLQKLFVKKNIAEEYQQEAAEFIDFNTLKERMKNQKMICQEFKARSGQWFLISFIVKKYNKNGKVTHILMTARNVNEQKSRELEYQKSLEKAVIEAQRADKAKMDFLRHMSHDIRTPINGIIGLTEMANRNSDDPKKLQEYRQRVLSTSQYLLSLVNNVLDMGKVESGKITLESMPFDLMDMIQQDITILNAQANDHGVKYTNDISLEHRYFIGSSVHLNRVLMNLANNAIKYNRIGGTVDLICKEFPLDKDHAELRFICKDTGVGMGEEFQKHVFEPFAQEGKPSITSYSGSGLGMPIAKTIIEQMGGTITFESKENVGTTFFVTVPMCIDHDRENQMNDMQEHIVDLHGKMALLVEDNELNMEIAKMFLEEEGMCITEAWNGQEAVHIFEHAQINTFDFIFMDIMMPVMDGLEATRHIRQIDRPDARSIPIIAMSANAFQDDIQRSLDAGMDAHLTKPLDVERMKRVIRQFAENNRD